jgi:hypothetical protein
LPFNDAWLIQAERTIMKIMGMKAIALLLFFSMHSFDHAWAQIAGGTRHPHPSSIPQPTQVVLVQPPLTDFERYQLHTDQPLVMVTFPVISADLGPDIFLNLTPRGITHFDSPDALKAVALEFSLSQSLPAARSTEVAQVRTVTALLDFEELSAFRALFTSLSATGMPRQPFPGAKALVRMASKSGMHLELTAEPGGAILCTVADEVDSIKLSLDADSARKWADAFIAARRVLEAAREIR